MIPSAALDLMREAKAEGCDITFADENPHWQMGYTEVGDYFHWSYLCGCDDPQCTRCDFDTYPTIEELIDAHSIHLRDKPDYDGWHRIGTL